MEISVGRLNNRMALQVPSELPLGLVFITGRVEQLSPPPAEDAPSRGAERRQVWFDLVDEQHRLRCRIPRQVVEETQLESGDSIRVSGHLLFDSRSVHYYLLARDLEVVATAPAELEPVTVPAKSAEESGAVVHGELSELPEWVLRLAPPEVQDELGLETGTGETDGDGEEAETASATRTEEESAEELPAEMLAFLSGAIDSDEEIELTRDMIREYMPEVASPEPEEGPRSAEEEDPAPGADRQRFGRDPIAPEDGDAGERMLVRSRATGQSLEKVGPDGGSGWMVFIAILIILSLLLLLALILWNPLDIGTIRAPGPVWV